MKILEGYKLKSVKDIGNQVICDQCNKDYSDSNEVGGFLFYSHGYCPPCAREALPRIKSYGEEDYIKAWCPDNMSFRDFILEIRGGDNTIKIYIKE